MPDGIEVVTARTIANYFLPPPAWKPRGKPYPSSWKMSPEEAAARGLGPQDIVPGTTEEVRDLGMQSAGLDGVKDGAPRA